MIAPAERTKPLLELRGFTVEFRRNGRWVSVVDGVDLSVAQGESVGLIGESGCGKSTTANAVLRLLPAGTQARVSGSVLYDGRDLLRLSSAEMRRVRGREITLIPQDPLAALNPLFTIGVQVREAVAAHGRHTRSELREAALRSLARVRLDAPEMRARQYPHELSGGMRQRVVGAIATACGPRLLIADEPTTALDVTLQAQYLDMLAELKRDTGLSMLFITHDPGVAARLCDRVAVMYAGRIVESGPVAQVFDAPAHWYTRALLGSVPPLDRRLPRLPTVAGAPPKPGEIVAGCRFAARCPRVASPCRESEPGLTSSTAERAVRCWFPAPGPSA
jgi:oligopeptide/dipeptide ABC transporter ATP-binding protein